MSQVKQTKRNQSKKRGIIEFSIYVLLSATVVYVTGLSWWYMIWFILGYFGAAVVLVGLFLLWRNRMKKKHKDWFVNETKNK